MRLRREGTAQFAVVAVEIETRAERGDHELRELAKPVAKSPLVAGQRCITTSDRLEVLWGLSAVLVGLAAPAAYLRQSNRDLEREAARRATPLPCRYYHEHERHVLSFSAVRVGAGFNVVAEAVDAGRHHVNNAPLFGRSAGTLRLVSVELEALCAYNGGRVVPGRVDGTAVYSAVLVFAERREGGTWEQGEPLDVDRFIQANIHTVATPLSH
jgi:hypothetical protein